MKQEEEEQVKEDGRYSSREHGPHWERVLRCASGWDHPPSQCAVRHRNAFRDFQLLGEGVTSAPIDKNHDHDGNGDAKVSQSSTGVPAKVLAVSEKPQEVGNEEGSKHEDHRHKSRVGLRRWFGFQNLFCCAR